MTKVTITEIAPDADQMIEQLQKDPVALKAYLRRLMKREERRLQAKQGRRDAIKQNRSLKDDAAKHVKERVLKKGRELIRLDPTLKYNTSRLAENVRDNLGPVRKDRTLRLWLAELREK
jgi:hypothetical protein